MFNRKAKECGFTDSKHLFVLLRTGCLQFQKGAIESEMILARESIWHVEPPS